MFICVHDPAARSRKQVFSASFGVKNTIIGSRKKMADFSLPGISQGSLVLVGAEKSNEDELFQSPIGRSDVVAAPGNYDHHHKGACWSLTDVCFAFAKHKFSRRFWDERSWSGDTRAYMVQT